MMEYFLWKICVELKKVVKNNDLCNSFVKIQWNNKVTFVKIQWNNMVIFVKLQWNGVLCLFFKKEIFL